MAEEVQNAAVEAPQEEEPQKEQKRVPISGWIALALLIVLLSGVFTSSDSFLKAFDFTNLSGAFGTIQAPVVTDGELATDESGAITTKKYTFQGSGGTGAREGIIVGLTLMPAVAFAFGLIDLCQSLGAMDAAEKLFTYILRPLYGIPGSAGIAYIASFTSSDIGANMTRDMVDKGMMTDKERVIFVSYQYPATAVIGNTISTQAALLPIIVVSSGLVIVVLWVCKTIGANLVRLALKFDKSFD